MNEKGLVVVAAKASGIMSDKIVFHIGKLEKNRSITWKDFDLALSEYMLCPTFMFHVLMLIAKQNKLSRFMDHPKQTETSWFFFVIYHI